MRWNKSFEGTLHIYDADLQKMAKMLDDVNIKECPYFDLSDRYGNSARYYRENQWIPCSERLPKYGQPVLTYNLKDDEYEVNHIIDEEDGEWFTHGVDAWMPLPEPYEENKE